MRDFPEELTHGPFTVVRALELGPSIEVLGGRRFRRPWPGVRVITVDGLSVTSPWRTWCDLAATGSEHVDLVILADALRRRFPGVADSAGATI